MGDDTPFLHHAGGWSLHYYIPHILGGRQWDNAVEYSFYNLRKFCLCESNFGKVRE